MVLFGGFTTKRELIVFGLCLAAALACAAAIVSQFGATSFFLFEVYLSLLPQILVFCVAVIALSAYSLPRLTAGLAALTFVTALPFLTFSKFERPTGPACGPEECFRILTINLWSESDYLPALAELIREYEVDILIVNESSVDTIDPAFEDIYFPQYDTVVHATYLNMPRRMGNPISFMSREPVKGFERVLHPDTGGRAYIAADLDEQWDGIRVITGHGMTPTSQTGLAQRNALLEYLTNVAEESESFILLGDFNMTPWSPTFATLPGKRAGDPRLSMTWPTIFPLLGMSIDHIMFSDDLELVDFQILRSIGSDHYPLLAQFRRRDPTAP
ncbi:MAG: endonuclease/exonuclease/phosphatase family protein [Henriciella sp.]